MAEGNAEGCKMAMWCLWDSNSIECTVLVVRSSTCSGIKGGMFKVTKTFVYKACINPVTNTGCTSVDIGVNANLELVDKF